MSLLVQTDLIRFLTNLLPQSFRVMAFFVLLRHIKRFNNECNYNRSDQRNRKGYCH